MKILLARAYGESNVAVTDFAASIVTVHIEDVVQVALPVPDQPINVDPPAGVAVSTAIVPEAKVSLQSPGQLMPAGDEVTAPTPVPAMVKLSVKFWPNVAVTLCA